VKTCPQCHQTYPDDLAFCLSDGSPLSNPSEVATVVKPRTAPRSGWTKLVIALLAGLLALSLGITAAVLYFFWPRRSETPANTNQVAVANSNRPAETPTATPQPTQSATPTPTRSPRPSETPASEDERPVGSDPGPTRISFGAGRTSSTVNGEVWRQRTYLLYASEGQRLNARINSPDECASFSNGSRSIGFSTSSGNNALTVINECDDAASFSLTVSIR
jgi:hypothetical protein